VEGFHSIEESPDCGEYFGASCELFCKRTIDTTVTHPPAIVNETLTAELGTTTSDSTASGDQSAGGELSSTIEYALHCYSR